MSQRRLNNWEILRVNLAIARLPFNSAKRTSIFYNCCGKSYQKWLYGLGRLRQLKSPTIKKTLMTRKVWGCWWWQQNNNSFSQNPWYAFGDRVAFVFVVKEYIHVTVIVYHGDEHQTPEKFRPWHAHGTWGGSYAESSTCQSITSKYWRMSRWCLTMTKKSSVWQYFKGRKESTATSSDFECDLSNGASPRGENRAPTSQLRGYNFKRLKNIVILNEFQLNKKLKNECMV